MVESSSQDAVALLDARLNDSDGVESFDLRVVDPPSGTSPSRWRTQVLDALYDSLRLSIPEEVRDSMDPDTIRESVRSHRRAVVSVRCWVRSNLKADGEMVGPEGELTPGQGLLTDWARSLVAARVLEERLRHVSE